MLLKPLYFNPREDTTGRMWPTNKVGKTIHRGGELTLRSRAIEATEPVYTLW